MDKEKILDDLKAWRDEDPERRLSLLSLQNLVMIIM